MTKDELIQTLNELRGLPAETEVFEFKEAKSGYDSASWVNISLRCRMKLILKVLRMPG